MLGVLLNNPVVGRRQSFARPAVNTGLAQPFVNYNMEKGWYKTTITDRDRELARSVGEKWTVPVGGGSVACSELAINR